MTPNHFDSFYLRTTDKNLLYKTNQTKSSKRCELLIWLTVILVLVGLFVYRNYIYEEPPLPVCPSGEKLAIHREPFTVSYNVIDRFTWFEKKYACIES